MVVRPVAISFNRYEKAFVSDQRGYIYITSMHFPHAGYQYYVQIMTLFCSGSVDNYSVS